MSFENTLKMPSRVILDSNLLPQAKGLKSTFNLSEGLKTTMNMDYIYPVYWEEMFPGDHFEVSVASVARLMPTVAPTMDNIKLKYMAFWVPNRLLWKNFFNFMGEKTYQDTRTDFLVPQLSCKDKANVSCSLADYLGVPPTSDKCDFSVSALPFRAYNKLWNDWFRSNQLQEPVKEYTGNNEEADEEKDTLASYSILKKGKPLDYFTSCLPYPQAGESVTIPLTGNAPVMQPWKTSVMMQTTFQEPDNRAWSYGPVRVNKVSTDLNNSYQSIPVGDTVRDTDTKLYADMSNVTGVSIEALRNASALQVLLERDARAGERYADLVEAHYNVTCPDFLLGRSQFLGSCTSPININPIAQNSSTDATTPQGHLVGIGVGQENSKLCEVSAVEHGIFMIVACASGEVNYQQGVHRKFSKLSRYDYMNPAFWNLGDQPVLNKEIFVSTNKKVNDAVFGYQERYRELREGVSKLTGKMRSGVEGSLDVWHLAEKFQNLPVLNREFIECNTPIDRILAVHNQPALLLDIWFDIKATRPLPVSSNPSLLAGRI